MQAVRDRVDVVIPDDLKERLDRDGRYAVNGPSYITTCDYNAIMEGKDDLHIQQRFMHIFDKIVLQGDTVRITGALLAAREIEIEANRLEIIDDTSKDFITKMAAAQKLILRVKSIYLEGAYVLEPKSIEVDREKLENVQFASTAEKTEWLELLLLRVGTEKLGPRRAD